MTIEHMTTYATPRLRLGILILMYSIPSELNHYRMYSLSPHDKGNHWFRRLWGSYFFFSTLSLERLDPYI